MERREEERCIVDVVVVAAAVVAAAVVGAVVVDVVVREMRQVWGQNCGACLALKAPMQNAAVLL